MIQTIATVLALVIGLAALIFTSIVMYKIFGGKKPKKVKEPKLTKKQKMQQQVEEQKTVEPEIKLFSAEKSKVTGFELDDD